VFFGFDDDEVAVRDAVASYFSKRAGADLARAAWEDPSCSAVREAWAELARIGAQGLLVPEEAGGSGMGWVAMALVLAEAGRAALPLPLAETAAVGAPLIAAAGDPAGALGGLLDGSEMLTAAPGFGWLFPAASSAEWFLVPGRLYRGDEVRVEAVASVDRSRDVGRVTPTGAGVAVLGDDMFERGALAAAAVLVGLGRALVDTTVSYVKERHQFGVPVGGFQAVKHHLADAATAVEMAAPAVWAAAWRMDNPDGPGGPGVPRGPGGAGVPGGPGGPGVPRGPGGAGVPGGAAGLRLAVSTAKALSSDAAYLAGRKALQCHGAIGYTVEHHLHMWLKRVWCLAAAFGSPAWHRRRVAAELRLAGSPPPAS
jgi:alkylation response protein AidB-like acyl-CoA dehydrogenase